MANNQPKCVPLTVVILTFNEAIHIERAIANVFGWANDVFVLDSGSFDLTVELAKKSGAKVFNRPFDNYAKQRQHAIKELPIKTDWMFFLDADEWLTEELKTEITALFDGRVIDFDGFMIKRRLYFMGRWIRFGGYYPTRLLRLFKRDLASCDREINEHIRVKGTTGNLGHDFIDENLKGFREWFSKQIRYAEFESTQFNKEAPEGIKFWRSNHDRKQWVRFNIWNRLMPPFLRAFVYFFYRYFLRLGFLDGIQGLIFHFMQGLVLHFATDAFYFEHKMNRLNKTSTCVG